MSGLYSHLLSEPRCVSYNVLGLRDFMCTLRKRWKITVSELYKLPDASRNFSDHLKEYWIPPA